ncbi:MAG: leucine-rich repeat protein [Lachnospiraceae bacterium]|nr:leucine-rich repeat protein [Lachnospiraceae bacterium]
MRNIIALSRKVNKGVSICLSIAMVISSFTCIHVVADSRESYVLSETAEGTYSDGNGLEFNYSIISDSEIEITEYTGSATDIEIPESIEDGKEYFIKGIGERAFYNSNIKTVVFPEGIEYIGDNAFSSCDNLTVPSEFPESLISIGDNAFYGCVSAKSLYLGANIEAIGENCIPKEKLTKITVSMDNKKYDSRDNCNAVFEKATFRLVLGCVNTVIPQNTVIIGECAFYGVSITKLQLPDSVKILEKQAFAKCTYLNEIDFSKGLIYIGEQCFSYNSSLINLTIPGTVKVVDCRAFEYCFDLQNLVIEEGVVSLGGDFERVFLACNNLEIITLPESLKNINEYEFDDSLGNSKVKTEIRLPNNSYAEWKINYNIDHANINYANINEAFYTIVNTGNAQNPIVEYDKEDANADNYTRRITYSNYYSIDITKSGSYKNMVYIDNDQTGVAIDLLNVSIDDTSVVSSISMLEIIPLSEGITLVHLKSKDALGVESITVVNVYDSTKDTDAIAIDNVVEKINALDRELIYPDDVDSISDARDAYDSLTDVQKYKMDDSYLEILENAESEIVNLKVEYEKNLATVEEIKSSIESLADEVAEYSDTYNSKLTAIESKYNSLEERFKKLVDNYTSLVNAREAYNKLKREDDIEKANVVIDKIADLVNWDGTLENGYQVTETRIAYGNLTDAQKLIVGEDNLKILETYEYKLDQLKKASAATAKPTEPVEVTETEEPKETSTPVVTKIPETEEPVKVTETPTEAPVKETSSPKIVTPVPTNASATPYPTASPNSSGSSGVSSSVNILTTATPNVSSATNASSQDIVNKDFKVLTNSAEVKNRTLVLKGKYGKAKQVKYVKVAKISWDIQSGATLYRVYRSGTEDGEYKVISETTNNTYYDSAVNYGDKYYYKVQCVKDDSSYSSEPSGVDISQSIIKPVVKVKSKAGKYIMLNYKKSEGEYQEVRVLSGKKWVKVKTMCGKISPNKVSRPLNSTGFYLKVRTYTKSKEKKIYSKWSKKIRV